MVAKRTVNEKGETGYFWCVVHGHADTGGERDAPKGTPIICYPYIYDDTKSELEALLKAQQAHAAIRISQEKE